MLLTFKCRCQSLIEIALPEQGFFIALVLDLVDENVLRPTELARHTDIEFLFQRVFATLHDDQIMRPTDLCNQRLHFWEGVVREIKLPHIEDVTARKSLYPGKFPAEIRR